MSVERVLIADGDYAVLDQLGSELAAHGYDVFLATNARELADVAATSACDVALVDLGLPGSDGLEAARALGAAPANTAITLMGDAAQISEHSDELLALHYGYLQKPVTPGQALLAVERAAELKRLREENRMLRGQWEENEGPDDFVSQSPVMIDVLRQAATAADTDEPVLICGAPGTEKEIAALYIHKCSARADGPFVRFECGRTTATVERTELFGREYHSSNGAVWRRSGRLELAAGGTLFMDNITELSPVCQAKLLRFISEGRFARARADRFGQALPHDETPPPSNQADVRIICACSRDLDDAAAVQGFRQDLLFRLSALSITLPPLSERRDDILPLAKQVMRRSALEGSKNVRGISAEAQTLLEEYDWPGNMAELRDTIRTAVNGAQGEVLSPEDLLRGPSRRVVSGVIGGVTGPSLEDAERQLILTTLHDTHGNKRTAARRLCITTTTLSHKLDRYRARGLIGAARATVAPETKKC